MQRAVHQLTELLLAESRQAIACHALHIVEQRFCRWVLECRDLACTGDSLSLTQEFLAAMLCVQRTTVSAVANQAQADGLIRYHRGSLDITDGDGLERRACECRRSLVHLRAALAPALFANAPPPATAEAGRVH